MGEAEAYLADETPRDRIAEISRAPLGLDSDDFVAVMGCVVDRKSHSYMTLFSRTKGADPAFEAVIDGYFGGEPDPLTLGMLGQTGETNAKEAAESFMDEHTGVFEELAK